MSRSRSTGSVHHLYRRIASADRGWKATLLGLAIALVVTLGPL